MSGLEVAVVMIAIMLVLMAIRVPIAVAMFVAGSFGYLTKTGWLPWVNHLNSAVFARFANYDLSVIPLFILMGQFASKGGLSAALFEFASALTRRLRGGLAMGSVIASGAFGAVCGSSVATAATITPVAYPEMKRQGYSARLATGTLAAGGVLGFLIPPSVPLVLYAIVTEQNLAKLFAAAMVPGFLAVLGYVLAIAIYVRMVPGQAPVKEQNGRVMSWSVVWQVLPIFFIFLLVFGGIYGGWFTPTDGAAVGAVATFFMALIKKELTIDKVGQCFMETAGATAMIFLILLGADMMNAALALTQITQVLAAEITSLGLPPYFVVSAILLFYLCAGAVMDEISVMLLTLPVFFPIVMGLDLGMAPEDVALWFGILVLITIGFGLLTPPVGLNVYVVNGLAKDVPIFESYKGVLPFLLSDVVRVVLVLAFPQIALWLMHYLT
ncbi:MAG: C4-dicarboxylate ABC transporter permease [Pusillimonas sp.]|nr:C4-dicarboxylate ABC transporter permease [Pusillimonas sp.]|tara:strand:- start:14424 stop:15743 length:1320 start_codon:yes stop_codon:yes gene_type:complete